MMTLGDLELVFAWAIQGASMSGSPEPGADIDLVKNVRRQVLATVTTKRELFAAMAMQAIVGRDNPVVRMNDEATAQSAIDYADALLAELAKEGK